MIEHLRAGVSAKRARVVLFDFDGTLSLVRSGWLEVMVGMATGMLLDLGTGETTPELRAVAREFIERLAGRQTIYQMIELAESVRRRGGTPLEPLDYKRIYLERLGKRIEGRVDVLRRGTAPPDAYLVPGARALLDALRGRGLRLYLASGTDEAAVRTEAGLLDIAGYFDGGIHGARDDPRSASKASLVRRIVDAGEAGGDELLVFGDGADEIESVKRVGGVAVGVASAEPECRAVDPAKRSRLANAGADLIVPNYLDGGALLGALFGEPQPAA